MADGARGDRPWPPGDGGLPHASLVGRLLPTEEGTIDATWWGAGGRGRKEREIGGRDEKRREGGREGTREGEGDGKDEEDKSAVNIAALVLSQIGRAHV